MPVAPASDILNEWADEEAGIEAVQRILDCLDDIYALQDAHVDADVLRDMLRDNQLHQLLHVRAKKPLKIINFLLLIKSARFFELNFVADFCLEHVRSLPNNLHPFYLI